MSKELPAVYWDAGGSGYWLHLDGEFRCLDKSEAGEHLIDAGLKDHDEFVGGIKKLNRQFLLARRERAVRYAGPLGGWRRGMHTLPSGTRILVTTESRVFTEKIRPQKYPPKRIAKFFDELLGDEQTVHLLAWLKVGRESLLRQDFRPAPVPVFAGEGSCGKSFMQALITEFYGGRAGSPYRYMVQRTNFNEDLAENEHLIIADQYASTDTTARRAFGAAIKDLVANAEIAIHPKGRKATELIPTWRRITISVNNEPENLMIVPPLDNSLRDKLMLFKCSPATLSWDKLINKEMFKDIPLLAGYLSQWPIPDNLLDDSKECKRYGFKNYWHSELLEVLASVAPETRLLELIDCVLFPPSKDGKEVIHAPVILNANELEQELRKSPEFGSTVGNLLRFWGSCGTYMSRLRVQHPERIDARMSKGKTKWIIRAP